jgi:hypothetical protein
MERVLVRQRRPAWAPHTREASPALISLAEQCWSRNASLRPSFECVCQTLQQLLQSAELKSEGQVTAAAGDAAGWEWMQQVKTGGSCYAAKDTSAAAAAAPAGCEDGSAASDSGYELQQQAGSSTLSTAWLPADEAQDMLQDTLHFSTADASPPAIAAPEVTPRAPASARAATSSSSGMAMLLLRRQQPPRRTVSFNSASCSTSSPDAPLYTIPEIPAALVQLTAVSDGGAACSCEGNLDALHQADQGLVKTLGRVRRLSNSSSCSAGAFAAGLDGALGGVGGIAAAAGAAAAGSFESEAAAAAVQLQQALLSRQAALGGVCMGGLRPSRCVHVEFGGFGELANDDPAVGWLLGRLTIQQQGAEKSGGELAGVEGREQGQGEGTKQAKQHVYASAGPASGPNCGYW